MNDVFFSPDKLPTFNEWLLARYDTTPMTLYELNKATGRYGEYDKLMEWYRRRYRREMLQLKLLSSGNPFINHNQED
jgi:hypothetical protein